VPGKSDRAAAAYHAHASDFDRVVVGHNAALAAAIEASSPTAKIINVPSDRDTDGT
jgi:hypothetical protein